MKSISTFLTFIFLIGVFSLTLIAQHVNNPSKYNEHQAVKNLILSKIKNQSTKKTSHSTIKKDDSQFNSSLFKPTAHEDRKYFFLNGNKISTNIYNYGGIAPGAGLLRNVNNVVWRNLGYVFQFCPIVGAEVVDTSGTPIHIISDGLWDYSGL